MNNYARGRSFEYRCKRALEEQGFWVIRAAQSKGIADLVAVHRGLAVLVQCKLGKGGIGPGEWNEFYRASRAMQTPAVVALALPRKPIQWRLLVGQKAPRGQKQNWIELTDLRTLVARSE